jgi:anti-sigma B factor antagonist
VLVDVQVHDEAGWTVISIVGELDLAVAPRVRHAAVEALGPARRRAGPPQVILDLGSVHFLDSTGVGTVFGVLRRVRQAGGALRVVVAEPQVLALVELLSLDAVLDIRPSLADALAAPVLAAPTPGGPRAAGGSGG